MIWNIGFGDISEHNGYFWQETVIKPLESLAEIEGVSDIKKLSILYVMGFMDGFKASETEHIVSTVLAKEIIKNPDSLKYYEQYNRHAEIMQDKYSAPFEYLTHGVFGQYMEGITEFYKDYRTMRIGIPDAFVIVDMELRGESEKKIEWWKRFVRSSEKQRGQMSQEKYKRNK